MAQRGVQAASGSATNAFCTATCCSEKLDVVRLTFYTSPISLACLSPFFWVYEVRVFLTGRLGGRRHVRRWAVPAPLARSSARCVTCPPQREKFLTYLPSHYNGAAFIILVSSINAVCYNMVGRHGMQRYCRCATLLRTCLALNTPPLPAAQVHSLMIKRTSAVTTTVLGEVKIVGLLVLSAMLLGEGKEFTVKMSVRGAARGLWSHAAAGVMRIVLPERAMMSPRPVAPRADWVRAGHGRVWHVQVRVLAAAAGAPLGVWWLMEFAVAAQWPRCGGLLTLPPATPPSSHTKIVKFRENNQPRVISLAATGGSAAELQPLKGDAGILHRVASGEKAEKV